jgi:hypothetical protein
MRPYLILAALVIVVGIIAYALSGGSEDDPEAQIREAIEEAVEAAQERDLGALMDRVSERFASRGMDRDALKGLLFVQLRRGDWRRVFLVNTEIDIDPSDTTARVRTAAVLATGDQTLDLEDLMATDAGAYEFDLSFALEEDEVWRVTAASYRAATNLKSLLPKL